MCTAQDRSAEPVDWPVGGPGVMMLMMIMIVKILACVWSGQSTWSTGQYDNGGPGVVR